MSNLFGNTAAAVAPKPKKTSGPPPAVSATPALDAVAPKTQTPPVQQPKPTPIKSFNPPLEPPVGPPSPALQQQGFFGGIGNFAQRVQTIVDAHTKAYGQPPSSKLTLDVARSQVPTQHLPSLFTVPLDETAARSRGVVGDSTPEPLLEPHKLLEALAGNTAAGGYDQFMKVHGQQVQDLLDDPETRAETQAALSKAKAQDAFQGVQESGPGLGKTVENLLVKAPFAAAKKAVQTDIAAGKDLANLDNAVHEGDWKKTQQAATMPNLTRTAPAVAQVVKGLVYAPAGVYEAGKALTLDAAAAEQGDYSFKHTAKLAKQTGKALEEDINHPGANAGNLALDIWGLASLGAGAAARVGRAASAVSEGEGVVGAARAAARQHPLNTFRLGKNGFDEDIKLSGSPLSAWLQEYTPGVGLRSKAARFADASTPTNLFGEPITDLGPQDHVTQWAKSVLSGEAQIGRAGNVRRTVELKAMLGLKAELDASANQASGAARLSRLVPGGDRLTGLSRGEQKALQALSWDDPHPIAAEERFHQSMIAQGIGDERAHREQLGELYEARKALDNPTEKFSRVLDKYLQVVAKTEEMRIQMGLGVETADARVAKAGAILREGEADFVRHKDDGGQFQRLRDVKGNVVDEVPLTKVREDSWYTPIVPKGKPRTRIAGETPFQRGKSLFGFGPPQGTNLFGHEMTGSALRAGDFRTDAHHLAGEAYAKTVRAMQVMQEWQKAWDAGTELPTSPHDIAIRDIREVPDELRKAVTDLQSGHIDSDVAEGLPDNVREWLFPPKTDEPIPNVRHIDPRMLGNAAKSNLPTGWGARAAERVNNFMRPLILYATPKYALNKVGNEAMLVLDQGFLRSAQNLAKALVTHEHLSEEAEARLKSLTGAGRSESYVTPKSGPFSQALADYWARFSDNGERKASFLYYANRKGYHGWDELENLLTNEEDPKVKADRVDVGRRSDEALGAFDRMTPWEKATIRHYIFVYAWQRAATIWSFHTVFEHPAKTAILNQLGQEAYEDDPWLKNAVAWVRRVGYIPLWWNGTDPVVADPTSVNTFSTIGQMLATAKAGVEGDKYASAGDLFGPPGQFAVHAILGVDQNGNVYGGGTKGQIVGAFEDAMNILPMISAVKRSQKGVGKTGTLPPFKVTDRASLEKRLNAALGQVVLQPGWLDGFGNLIAGGFSPRELNLTAAAARYWQDATPEQRHARELDLLNRALDLQGEYLKQPVPKAVRQAVRDGAQLTFLQSQFTKAHGRTPTEKEKLLLTIGYYKDAGRIDTAAAAKLDGRVKKLEAQADIRAMSSAVHHLYGNGKALYQWDSDVSTVAGIQNPANFNARTTALYANGLAGQRLFKVSPETRAEYGRGYVAYQAEREALKQKIANGKEDSFALKVFDDEHDKPVSTNLFGNTTLPSYSRFRLTEGSADAITKRITGLVNASWPSLSGVEKTALGVPTPPDVSTGWAAYKKAVKAYEADPNNPGIQKDQKAGLAREIDKVYPGFLRDFEYSQQPKILRFQATSAYKAMPDRGLFNKYIGGPAKQIANAIKANGDASYYLKYWRKYVAEQVRPWLEDQPSLKKEIGMYDKSFLDGLASSG